MGCGRDHYAGIAGGRMAVNIDTTDPQYQQYLTGLDNLRTLMIPRLKAFDKLGKAKQHWWLQRDPLLRKLLKTAAIINKHILADSWMEEIQDD